MNKLIAIPSTEGELSTHFGHCQQFALVKVEENQIKNIEFVDPPVHKPGAYPKFLREKGVDLVIVGGIGEKAKDIFKMNNIEVLSGANSNKIQDIVNLYLENKLILDENKCSH